MSSDSPPPGADPVPVRGLARFAILRTGPLRLGFFLAIGVLLALLLAGAVMQLASVLTLLFLALFISMGLHPVVTGLQRRGLAKPVAILIVIAAFVAFVALLLLLIVPTVVDEGGQLLRSLPKQVMGLEQQEWFIALNAQFNDYPSALLAWLRSVAADPNTWVAIGGGALGVLASVINGTFSFLFVVIVTLYFIASMGTMKQALYELVPGSKVARFSAMTEEIVDSIGKYLGGQVIIAAIMGVFSFLLMTVLGLPYAAIIGFSALLLSLVPVVGTVTMSVIMTFVALLSSPTSAIIVGVVMLVYMQIESYVLAPRIIGKAIQIPSSLVLIGAVAGAALGGLLGALVAAPVAASILLIIKQVVVPAQRLK